MTEQEGQDYAVGSAIRNGETPAETLKKTLPENVIYEQAGIHIEFDEEAHSYLVNGEKFPSASTILNKHVGSDEGLARWSENMVLEGVAWMAEQGLVIPTDPEKLRSELWGFGKLGENERDRKKDIGLAVHDIVEVYAKTGQLPNLEQFQGEEAWGYVQAFAKFVLDVRPHIIDSEVMVASLRHRFAGRYDLRLALLDPVEANVLTAWGDGDPMRLTLPAGYYLADIKTTNKVKDSHGEQLALYEQASIECGFPKTDHRAVIQLRPNGTYCLRLTGHNRGDGAALAKTYHRHGAGNKRTASIANKLKKAAA